MVVVRLFGGLGNQMFQYATGKAISLKLDQPLRLENVTGFEGDFYQREFELNNFNIVNLPIAKEELPSGIFRYISEHGSVIKRKLRKYYYYLRTLGWDIQTEDTPFFKRTVFKQASNKYLSGYWQSYKYFETIRDTILNDFTLRLPLDDVNSAIVEKMQASHSISLHIRRLHGISAGVTSPAHSEIHGALNLGYYQKAIDYLNSQFTDMTFFVFSDDVEWAKENVKLPYPVYFMDQNRDSKSYLDLTLMSQCKHQIIANSSFSWWGAWLNKNPDKIVIAPDIWFVNKEMNAQTTDLFPASWIRL